MELEVIRHHCLQPRDPGSGLGISESRRPGEDDYNSDGFSIFYSGEESQRGVAIILDKRTAISVVDPKPSGSKFHAQLSTNCDLIIASHNFHGWWPS